MYFLFIFEYCNLYLGCKKKKEKKKKEEKKGKKKEKNII